uniref:META domain-containing protein n=1 Tax=uncultured Christiangramia sp. TaxID=503836 RepID=UPI00262FDC05|nr:META domain-containing protein [uncultured Christiangramia sp.]
MNKSRILYLLLILVLVISCSSSKNNVDKLLFNTTWELEYLSESSMEVSELYTTKKPQITFYKTLNTLKGNSGCNGYSADFSLDDDKVSIGEPGPATKIYCGEGEQLFLNSMQKVNTIKFDDDGKLNLMDGNTTILRFAEAQ